MDPGLCASCVIRWDLRALRREGVHFVCGKCMNTKDTFTLVAQSCLTLWPHGLYSPSGSSVHEILQARILEWVAIPFSRWSSWPRDWTWVSRITGRFFTVQATREVLFFFFFSNNGLQWISPLRIQTLVNSPPHWLWDWMYDFWPMGYQANIVPVMEGHVEITA